MSQIKKKFIENNAVDGSKIQLLNNQTLRAKDNSGEDRDLFYFSTANEWYFSVSPKISVDPQAGNDLVRKSYVDSSVATEATARASAVLSEQSARIAADNALDGRLDILEGSNTTVGSVAKAEKDAKDYTDQKIADLINGAPGVLDTLKELSDALGGDENFATTLASQLAQIDSDISALESASGGNLSAEESARIAADNALDSRLDVLEGSNTTAGSVAKALKDAKDYADAQVLVEQSARVAADLSEQSARIAADSTLQSNIAAEESARIASVNAEITARMAADGVEMTARMAADSTLQSNIDAEQSARIAADNVEQSARIAAVNAEITARAAAVSAEEAARIAADDALDGRLDILEGADTVEGSVAKAEKDAKDYTDTREGILQGQIDQLDGYTLDLRNDLDTETTARVAAVNVEQSARIAADSTLQSNITAEESARIAADNVEKTARMAADSTLQSNLDAEVTARMAAVNAELTARVAADDALDARLDVLEGSNTTSGSVAKALKDAKDYTDSEITSLINSAPGVLDTLKELADAIGDDPNFAVTVATNISSEATARAAADSTLQSNIDAEKTARMAADSTLQSNLDAEQTARVAADLSEQSARIAADNVEMTARMAADSTLQSNLDAEVTARMAADSTLQSNLDAEVTARMAAVDAEITARAAAVTAEASARSTADTNLQNSLDAEVTARTAAVNAEITARMAADDAEITARTAAIQSEASARSAADSTLTSSLNAEITARVAAVLSEEGARIAADGVLQGNIDAEESARIAADNAEQTARVAADSTLQSNITAEQSARVAADDALDARLDVLEGSNTTAGSVAKALKDAKDYTDAEVSGEASLRTTADSALQSSIDQINAVAHEKQKFVLSGTDISNGYINLSHQAIAKSLLVMVDRLVAHEGDDYTLSVSGGVTRVTFINALVSPGSEALIAGDVVRVMYRYQG